MENLKWIVGVVLTVVFGLLAWHSSKITKKVRGKLEYSFVATSLKPNNPDNLPIDIVVDGEIIQDPFFLVLTLENVGFKDVTRESLPQFAHEPHALYRVFFPGATIRSINVTCNEQSVDGGGGADPSFWEIGLPHIPVGSSLRYEVVSDGAPSEDPKLGSLIDFDIVKKSPERFRKRLK